MGNLPILSKGSLKVALLHWVSKHPCLSQVPINAAWVLQNLRS
jgi:hypothetical protein